VDHVGIYIGEGKFLHAPRTGRDVTVSSLSNGYWSQKYMEARRLATGS
jgi:cell wall-associated NlpC family hydrolase